MVSPEQRSTHSPFSKDRFIRKPEVKMLTTGPEIITTMVSLIHQAKHSVDMQYYAFQADETGMKILTACKEAKAKNPNLKIRLLIDNSVEYLHNGKAVFKSQQAKEGRDTTKETLMQMRDDGILEDVMMTNQFDLDNRLTNTVRLFSNVFHRDHKKLFLVDARNNYSDATPQAIVGSANITDEHGKYWRDAGKLFIGGDIIAPLEEDFNYTFRHAKKWERVYSVPTLVDYFKTYGLPSPKQAWTDLRGAIVRNAERKGRRIVFHEGQHGREDIIATDSFYGKTFGKDLFGAREATQEAYNVLSQAKSGESVIICSPYPGFYGFTDHLIDAAQRGVQIKLIVPKNNNHVLYDHKKIDSFHVPALVKQWAHRNLDTWEQKLAKNNIGLYKYHENGGMIHFKGMLLERADGTTRSLIGSLNFSKGPIAGLNREIIVATEGTQTTEPMVGFMHELLTESDRSLPHTGRRLTKSS